MNPLGIRRRFGRDVLAAPEPFGPAGWHLGPAPANEDAPRVIVTVADHPDTPGVEWVHASISRRDRMPDYDDLKTLHEAVFGTGWAYQVFAPPAEHVNIHEHALHLFGRDDGTPALPDFTFGSGQI